MTMDTPLRVAALVDLPRAPDSGGHVKCWERLASAAVTADLPLDLTVYFSGPERTEILGPATRIRHLPPVFSTAKLAFLPYVPDHTDLAPFHPHLARELAQYDVIHTTDGFFAFARTVERIHRAHDIPIVNSFHTDTPSYARIFTHQTIEKICGHGWLARKLIEGWKLPERQEHVMEEKLRRHLGQCRAALVTRAEDHAFAESILGAANVHHLRLGVDKVMFGPHRRDREDIEADYNIPKGRIAVLFVGRVDIGKNIYTLTEAFEKLLAEGCPLHLVVAGKGPASADVKNRLGAHATLPGFVAPAELARLYASVDGLALASEVEIRSMAGVEAMASGCPVLVSEKSGVAQLFKNTPAMTTVASGTAAWTDALRAFAGDPARQEKMRTAALEYGSRHLAIWQDVLAEDLFAVWQDAAGRAAHTRAAA
jgi:glycosyltransferase involved in cell wall biosynthesis